MDHPASGYAIGIGFVFGALVVSRIVWMAYEHDRIIRRVDAFLTVWARHGHWPPECQAALDVILQETDLRRDEEPPVSMGMGFGQVLAKWFR